MKTAIKTAVFCVLVLVFGLAHAQLSLQRHTISSGGGKASGGSFELTGVVAQHDSAASKTGGPFTLNSGLMIPNRDLIFKNNLE